MMIPQRTRPIDDPRNGPVVLRRELLVSGFSDDAIRRLVVNGSLVRVRRGAFVDSGVWKQLDEEGRFGLRGRAVLKQAKTSSALSHASGLAEYGAPLWGIDLSEVHVTRTDGLSTRHEAGVHQHSGLVRPGDLALVNGVSVMNPSRIALECTTLGNTEAALCVTNDLLHRGLTTPQLLNDQYVGMDTWPDTLPAEIVLRLADGRIESIGESRTFYCCFQQGLPMPEPQYKVRDPSGRVVARVDFAWPRLGVFLEFDGKIKYERLLKPGQRASEVVVKEKEREALICRLTGWRCVRVTWADLASPARLAARIREALFPSAIAS